jgi:very-short-patch-repair endonuclease
MSIKSETIAKLLFRQAIYKRVHHLFKEYSDIEDAKIMFSLYEEYEEDFNEMEITPIERIMYAILMNCHNGMNYVVLAGEDSYPYHIFSYVGSQVKIGKYTCDFLIETSINDKNNHNTTHTVSKIVIECDGHDFHEKTKEQAARDKKRDRFIVSKGYKLLRYSGSEIYNNFESIIDEIDEILEDDIRNWLNNNNELFYNIVGN